MAKRKESLYKKYISQIDERIKKGYYFEAAWIEYVLLEDRLVSLLRSSENASSNSSSILMMGPKIKELKLRMRMNQNLEKHLKRDNLIPRLDT